MSAPRAADPPAASSGRYAGLHVLADDDPRWPLDPVAQARAALKGGAPVIQLRAKHSGDARALEWAREIRALTREAGAAFVVNDRFDLALASEADAVHLGQEDLPPRRLPAEARARLGVGRSTHSPDEAREALREGVDYLAYGPVFGTRSKDSPYSARGLERLREIVAIAGDAMIVVAIGGIQASNLTELVAVGAGGAAVISAVAGAPDPEAAARELARHAAWDALCPARE